MCGTKNVKGEGGDGVLRTGHPGSGDAARLSNTLENGLHQSTKCKDPNGLELSDD